MDYLCQPDSHFWRNQESWNATIPRFDKCFDRIVFIIVPCIVFWILALIELPILINTKEPKVSYQKFMIAKMVNCGCLFILSVIELICTAGHIKMHVSNYPLDYVTICFMTITYGLAIIYFWLEMKKGMYSTWLQFIFWTVLAITEIIQFRGLIVDKNIIINQIGTVLYAIKVLKLPFILAELVMVWLSDNIFIRLSAKDEKINNYPEKSSSIPGKLLFSWFNLLLWKSYRKNIQIHDLWELDPAFESSSLDAEFESVVKKEKKRNRDQTFSLLKVLLKLYYWDLVCCTMLAIIGDFIRYMTVYLQVCLVNFAIYREPHWHGYFYVILMSFGNAFQATFISYAVHIQQMASMKVTSCIMAAIFRKSMRLSNEARKNIAIGEITNIMSVDTQRFIDLATFVALLYATPVAICMGIWLIWRDFGPASLPVMAIWIITVFSGIFLNMLQKRYHAKLMILKDKRIKYMNEILRGIKVLKMNAWEPCLMNQVKKIRSEELKAILISAWSTVVNCTTWGACRILVPLATFGTYFLINPSSYLRSNSAFVVIAVQNYFQYTVLCYTLAVPTTIQLYIGIKRMERFLLNDELEGRSPSTTTRNSEDAIIIKDASFKWGKTGPATLFDINLHIRRGELLTVIGPVGSGKSSLLFAILGEMVTERGIIATRGSIGYVAQQGWLQNATIKNNILFGKPYDENYYRTVIDACALVKDFETLPDRDKTEIGERGVTLSGGQILRVTLARAVYSRADIYLLDDPLSAVDAFVGKHIFERVIGSKGILNYSARILSTHITTYLPKSDVILILNDGEVAFRGKYSEMGTKEEFSKYFVRHRRLSSRISSASINEQIFSSVNFLKIQAEKDDVADIQDKAMKLVLPEDVGAGNIRMSMLYYIRSMKLSLASLIVACFLCATAFAIAAEFWLSAWASDIQGSDEQSNIHQRNYRMGVYAALGCCYTVLMFVAFICLQFGNHHASDAIHWNMLENLFHLPMTFFDSTPKGRILNRFSKDIDVIDLSIPLQLNAILRTSFLFFTPTITVCIAIPWFIIGVVIILIIYVIIQRIFVTASRKLNRLEAVSRSPVFAVFTEALAGCETIRAFQTQGAFYDVLDKYIDINRCCYIPLLVACRWLESHLAIFASLLVALAGVLCVVQRDVLGPSIIALIIANVLAITRPLGPLTYFYAYFEVNIISVERIKEYSDLKREADWDVPQHRPPAEWPKEGSIEFQNYSTRYREGLELSLRNVNCVIKSGEKIGIVGRTGAGKSSTTLALFRIIEAAQGSIFIDGVDISKMGLHDLRNKVTIIPQDPVMFTGSIRFNLDPWGKHSDEELYEALENSSLKTFVQNLDNGLDHELSEGGENLSAGQKQLLCLARALLRNTKIVVLDEATASIDLETDDFIQDVIRKKFVDYTVLVIAHRLSTVIDNDRIMVLQDKTIAEFDSPKILLKDKSTIFYHMAKDAGLVR